MLVFGCVFNIFLTFSNFGMADSETFINSDISEEGRLPLPGGKREDEEQLIQENIYTDEIIKKNAKTASTANVVVACNNVTSAVTKII